MSVRSLCREMHELYGPKRKGEPPKLRGVSYGGIRKYVGDAPPKVPRIELLRAIAEVLEVRPEWLAFNDGPITEREARVQQVARANYQDWWREEIRPIQEEMGEGAGRIFDQSELTAVVFSTLERLLPPERSVLSGLGATFTGSTPLPPPPPDPVSRERVKRTIGRALRQPLDALDLEPRDLTATEFSDYVNLMCQGLRRLEDAHRRRSVNSVVEAPAPRRGARRRAKKGD